MLKELKSPQKDSDAWCSNSDRLQMAEDTLAAVRRVSESFEVGPFHRPHIPICLLIHHRSLIG